MNPAMRLHLSRLQWRALAAGLLCLAGACAGAPADRKDFFISYLFGYLFWLGLALGSLVIAMMHQLTGGRWGFVIRRFLEAAFCTLPLMALLFLPLFFGLHELYPWARHHALAADPILRHRQEYMNPPAYAARTVFFFAIWIGLAGAFRRESLLQDSTMDPTPTRRLRRLSGPGIVVYTLTASLAYVDWIMSLETNWYSTMFAVLIIVGQMLSAFSFMIILLIAFRGEEPLASVVTPTHFHHLANLLLAFVMLWTYMAFSQFLVIWSGNLPHEIGWYLHRIGGSWRWIVVLLALFHFFLPFCLLLSRDVKKRLSWLAAIAGAIFAVHLLDLFWLVAPTFYPAGIVVHWMNLAVPAGIGGVWLAAFAFHLKRAGLLPVNDPRLAHAIELGGHE